ncbi:MAG: HEWD family protein [Halobacteriales archaeon]
MADVTLNPPEQRTCVVCGREDVWDAEDGEWRIREVDGERQVGEPYCLHEWDITGNHRPITV